MSNFFIGYLEEPASNFPGISAGGSVSGHSPSLLRNLYLKQTWRTANALTTSTVLVADLYSSDRPVQVIGLMANNISKTGATYQITAYDEVYDEFDVLVSHTDRYDSGVLSCDTQSPNLMHALPNPINAQYWKIQINDTGNVDGYVEAGYLFIGPALNPVRSIARGSELGYKSGTEATESMTGFEVFNEKLLKRVFSFDLTSLTNDEQRQLLDIQRLSDISKPVLVIKDSNDTVHRQKYHFMGRFAQLSPIKNPYASLHQSAVEVIEIV